MSQFSFFPQADGSDPLADALSQYRRSKKTLGQRSEREESGMQFGRAVAGLLNDLDPLSWVVSPSSVMDDIGDFSTFIDRVKTIETKKQLDSEMASGKLTPQEMLLRQQQIEVLDKMIASEAEQAAAATQEEIEEKGVVGMFGQGVKAGVTQGVVSSMRGFANLMPVDGDAFWSGAQRETGMATPEDSVSGKIGQAVGSGLFSAASFTVNPYLGTAVMGLQGYGGGIEAYDQAYQYGLTTGDYNQFQKITSGLTSAAIEAATETLGYGIASRLAKTGVAQWFAQPGARAVMGTVGKMYAGEALEEGLVPILQNGVKMTGLTGMQPAEWKEAFSQAATDAFYGGFGGFGAAAVNVPAEIVRRQQTNKLLREAGSKYADQSFVEEIAPKRAAALQAMTPEERALESDQAEKALMQAGADLGKAKENVGAVQAQLIAKQQELARARRGRDQARIQALEAEVATGEAGLATARQNAASIAADYAAAQFNYLTALASMSAGAPTVQMTVDDVLSSQQYNPATSATTAQKAVEQQLTRLGFKVQYYDGGQQGDTRPAFFSPQTPDTVYLRADGNMKFSEMMGLAMHELTHWAQFNDSGLWRAMRETMDDQTMLAAATEYWQQAAGIDPQVRQSLAQIMAETEGKPISGDDVAQLESRMGRSLVESEGAAKMIENGAAALFRGEAVPGWFGQLVTRMGLRGRSAMSALKLYRGLQEAAKNNKGYTPGKVGFTIDAAQRGLEVMRRARLQAAGAVAAPPATPQPQAAPAPATTPAPAQPAPAAPAAPAAAPAPAPAPTAAAPAPAAPAPSPAAAAPAPAATTRAAIDAAAASVAAAPDPSFFAPSANEVAAADIALEQRASEDAAAGRPNPYEGVTGEEMARLMTYVDAVDGGLLPGQMVTSEQRRIAKEMRRKIRRTVGTISARGKAVPETIDDAAIIDSIIPIASSQQWKNMRLFKKKIQDRVRKAAKEAGIDLRVDSPRVNEYIRRMVIKEVRAAIKANSKAVGWYDEKVRKALAIVALIHPELQNDRMAQFAFKWALAVTSNGAKVDKNFVNALKAYEEYKKTGVMPTNIGEGKPADAINNALGVFNTLVAKYGIERVEQFMSTKHTVREIKAFTGIRPSGEAIDSVLYGAAIVGPKIGNGFFANLYGHFEQLTMDRWFMRTFGRWTGTLIDAKPKLVKKRREQMRRVFALMDEETRSQFFASINTKDRPMTLAVAVKGQPAEVQLTDAVADRIAEEIQRASVDKDQRQIINEIGLFDEEGIARIASVLGKNDEENPYHSFGDELRKIGNGLAGAKDGQKEAPSNGTERSRIRSIFKSALEELNQEFPELTMADLQAVIWYPEKRLYDASKTDKKKAEMDYEEGGAPDYETAARKVAKERNVSDDQIRNVTERIDDDIRTRRAATARPVAGSTTPTTVAARASARTDDGGRGAGDRGGVGAARSLAPLADAPIVEGATGPDPDIVAAAERYAASIGIDLKRQAYYAKVDLGRAKRLADAFDAMPHAPNDPAVVEAYDALIDQTVAQYRALEEAGYKFWFFDEKTDPYDGKPWMALRDLRRNKTMAVFSTQAGFGTLEEIDTSGNPLLVDTGIRWPNGSPDGPMTPVLANDLFRAVHDAFGHSLEGAGFRARGEENAWQAHVRLFYGPAVGAMTTETRGQNSWLNFGPYGEQNRNAGVLETVFAPQKTGLMPEWTWTEGRVPDMPDQPQGPGGGQPAVSTSSARQQFEDVAKLQRGAPERAMLDVQAVTGGSVLDTVVEHGGDIVNRYANGMAMVGSPDFNGEVSKKLRRVLALLEQPYGFERELNEQLSANARDGYPNRFAGSTFEQQKARVDDALRKFAEAHAALPGVNSIIDTANRANVAVGEGRFTDAASLFRQVLDMVRSDSDVSIMSARAPQPISSFTPEWRAWFGDSKVVDEQGNPMVVYHGTNKDFSVFRGSALFDRYSEYDSTKSLTAGDGDGLFFFSADPDTAASFTSGLGSSVIPAYLKIENLFDPESPAGRKMLQKFLRSRKSDRYIEDSGVKEAAKDREITVLDYVSLGDWQAIEHPDLLKFIKDSGYDGIRVWEMGEHNLAVFNSSQIKSAFNERPTQSPSISSARQQQSHVSLMIPSERFFDEVARGQRKWAVTDDSGNPAMVFHASRDPGVLRPFASGSPDMMFFAKELEVAESYTRVGSVFPAWISAKRPATIDFGGTDYDGVMTSEINPQLSKLIGRDVRVESWEDNYDNYDESLTNTHLVSQVLFDAGYDAVVITGVDDSHDKERDYGTIVVVNSADTIISAITGQRVTESDYRNPPTITSARIRQSREDLAYQIGRRSGQVAGVARGRQQREAEVREAQREAEARARAVEETRRRAKEQKREQRVRERAKRAALAGRMQARLARLSAEIRRRQRREGERMEDFSRRALREMMREAQTASGEGYRQAKRDLSRLKREAIELINLLPPRTRSRYLPRIAELSSAAGVLKVADSVVRDMTRNEARVTFNRLRALQQQFTSRRGIRNDTRDQAMPLIQSGMAMLGGDRLMGYTDMADMVQRIGAARQLLEEARDLYEQDREAWREGRAERQQERADAAEVLAQNIERLDELPDSRLWSTGRTAGFVGKFFAANSDIHTLAEIIDGAIDGPIHEMIARLAAGKNAMNLDRRRIDQTMDGLLQQAGYSSVDDYAQRAAGMGGVAATDVMDVMLGGQSRRITSGEAMSLAAMDDDTLALLFDENDPEFAGSPITFLRDGGKLPVRVTRQEVEAIRARLSQGQIALIDGLKAMIDADIRQRAFDVHYAQFGRMPEAIPGYYPRRRLGDSISGDTVDVNATPGNVIMTMLDNAGFTRQRVASRAPLVVDDLVRTIDGHVDQGLRLIHLSDPLRFGITVLRDANVKSAMESRLGAKSNDQMRKLLMNGVGLSGRPTGDFIDTLNSNVSGALLLINPKTWFRQLGGIFRLASEFDMGDWASGSRASIALTPAQRSDLIDRIEQDSGYFFDRHRRSQVGLFAGIIGDPRQNRERMMVMLRAVGSNLRSAVDEATQANFRSMLEDLNAGRSNVLTILRSFDWALRGIDRQVMLAGYMSARQSLSRTDPAMAEQDAHLAAIALAERAFRRTQNVSDPMDDTVFAAEQKFNKGYGRLLFPFSSDPLKAFNQARRAVANPDARAGTAFGITANILWSAAANPLSVGLAGLATGFWASDDEDDKLLKQAIVNQQAQRAMERAAGDLVGSAFGYGGLILNDVYQAYRAYQDGYAPDAGIQIMPLQVANEVLRNFAAGEYGAMAGDVATLAGIPVTTPIESIRRDIARVTPTPEKIRDALLAKKRGSGLTADEERRLKAAQQQVRLNKLQTAE